MTKQEIHAELAMLYKALSEHELYYNKECDLLVGVQVVEPGMRLPLSLRKLILTDIRGQILNRIVKLEAQLKQEL